MPIVHVHLIEGRSNEHKFELAQRITAIIVECLAVQPSAVRVLLHETAGEHWFVAGEAKAATKTQT